MICCLSFLQQSLITSDSADFTHCTQAKNARHDWSRSGSWRENKFLGFLGCLRCTIIMPRQHAHTALPTFDVAPFDFTKRAAVTTSNRVQSGKPHVLRVVRVYIYIYIYLHFILKLQTQTIKNSEQMSRSRRMSSGTAMRKSAGKRRSPRCPIFGWTMTQSRKAWRRLK